MFVGGTWRAVLVDALWWLEHRGYDSAGIATIVSGRVERRCAPGKIDRLADTPDAAPLRGRVGIGHLRWATPGVPNETNAQLHLAGGVAVVHHWIIESFQALRAELDAVGHIFATQTGTEVVRHLVDDLMRQGQPPEPATMEMLRHLEGALGVVLLFESEADMLVATRKGSPPVIAYGEGEMLIGSNALALAPLT